MGGERHAGWGFAAPALFLIVTCFFLQVAAWSSVEHRSTGAARRSVASSPLDLFLMI